MTRIAAIGCGGWGKNLVRNLAGLGALAIIVDPSDAARQIAADLDVPHEGDVSNVLDRADIDAVVIATPAVTHYEVARLALLAGKDVYVEKPIALSVDEGRALADIADAHGRVLMVGHLLQYHPVFQKLVAMVQAGDLGKVSYISSSRLNFGLLRTEENVLWSFAPHDVSMVLGIAGQAPLRVLATQATILQPGIPDITTVQLEFDSGITAEIRSSWLNPEKEQKLIVVGDKGMAVFSDREKWADKLVLYPNAVDWTSGRPKAAAGQAVTIAVEEGEPLKLEMAHFIDCIQTRARPRTDAIEAIQVLAVLQAAQRSMDNGSIWCQPEAK
jgi:UDP-2-acetamido-3-amino-2,3-dideoxy-glucuronate N-acetyltransferase